MFESTITTCEPCASLPARTAKDILIEQEGISKDLLITAQKLLDFCASASPANISEKKNDVHCLIQHLEYNNGRLMEALTALNKLGSAMGVQ